MNLVLEGMSDEPWFQQLHAESPVAAAILEEILSRCLSVTDLASTSRFTLEMLDHELGSLAMALTDLVPWIVEVTPTPSAEQVQKDIGSWVERLQTWNFSGQQIAEAVETAKRVLGRRRRGRPPDRKRLGVKAYETKATNPSLRWIDVAKAVCDCNKRPHDEYCKESIRQEAQQLREALKKYGIQVPLPPVRARARKARDLPIGSEE